MEPGGREDSSRGRMDKQPNRPWEDETIVPTKGEWVVVMSAISLHHKRKRERERDKYGKRESV